MSGPAVGLCPASVRATRSLIEGGSARETEYENHPSSHYLACIQVRSWSFQWMWYLLRVTRQDTLRLERALRLLVARSERKDIYLKNLLRLIVYKLGPLELGYPLNSVTPPNRPHYFGSYFTLNEIKLIICLYILFNISASGFLSSAF